MRAVFRGRSEAEETPIRRAIKRNKTNAIVRWSHRKRSPPMIPTFSTSLELVEDGADFGQLVAVGGDDGDVAGVEARLLADHFDIVL